MNWLLDTPIISEASKKNPSRRVMRWLERHADDCGISIVSLGEIRFGAETSPDDETKRNVQLFLAPIRSQFGDAILDIDEQTIVEWKNLIKDLKTQNRTITCEDSLIAATSRQHNLTIVTKNVRHFHPTGLKVFNPDSG